MAHLGVMVAMVLAVMAVGKAQEGSSCVDANQRTGVCSFIRNCEPLRQLLAEVRRNTASSSAIQTLRNSVCHVNSNEILVCCATSSSLSGGEQPTAGGRGSDLLPTTCGISALTDRIIDGEDAPLLAWPWMVLLKGTVRGSRSKWFCGGVLINKRYVLTAAHCFKERFQVKIELVRVGEHTLSVDPDCEQGVCAPTPQDIPVERVILHPQYDKACRECDDIALLRLSRPVVLHSLHVMPICLPIDPQKDMGYPEEEFKGKIAWAAGWGSVSRDPFLARSPDKLQQVQLPIINNGTFCKNLRGNYPISRSVMCAGGEGKDTCKGDSGGPLILSNDKGTKRFVVGITSRGPSACGSQNTQGLYSNVHFYISWILDNMEP